MKVKEVMTPDPQACAPTNSAAEAAGLMWQCDCGVLPVVTDDGTVVGLITDRDICMAGALKGRALSDIAVEEVISGDVFSTSPDDDVRKALATMQDRKVRRVPVVNADGKLEGIVSLHDIVHQAIDSKGKATAIALAELIDAYKAISTASTSEQVKAAGRSA